jgi:4-hydroxybenzoate polyprenyltransferase
MMAGLPLVRLFRPQQWVKNGFVLAPLLFSRSFLIAGDTLRAVAAAAIFCGAASAGYIVNDILDRESDRRHPLKSKRRPIASGEVSVRTAAIIAGLLIPLLLVAAFVLSPPFAGAVAAYLALSVAYSARLKRIPIIDLFTIAVGFVLRVWGGAVVIPVALSVWMFVTTLSLALFLAATKRRQELLSSNIGTDFRLVLEHYTVRLMESYADMAAVATFVFYGLYIVSVRPQLAMTLPLVLFGMFRYRYVMEISHADESPTDRLVRDPQMLACVLVWAGLSAWLLQR